jgi:hypothetical protein
LGTKALDPSAPPKLRLGAAKGMLPGLKPGDIVTVVAALAIASDPEIASIASDSLAKLPKPVLDGALSSHLQPGVLDALARHNRGNDDLLGKLLDHAGVDPDTVAWLAETGSEALCERIATNEQRLLANPIIVERLYMNRSTRMSTADRVLELAVRNGIELNIPAFREAATAIVDELIAQPCEEPSPDDLLFQQVDELARTVAVNTEVEDTHELDDEGKEQVKKECRPLWVQLGSMTISQKIRRAMLGTSAERLMLVRDTNRLVASAAIRSPMMKDNEVVQVSASRSVSEDVLRVIAQSKEWTRNHQIKFNLVTNPRTPLTFAAQLLLHLRDHELRAIARSKNVTGAISAAARQHLARKTKKG